MTVCTPSINKKKAIKNINTFLYLEMDFKVVKMLLIELLNIFFDELIVLSLKVIEIGNKKIVHHTETVMNDHLIASACVLNPNNSGLRLINAFIKNNRPPPK
jgi:hypothetical protein